MVSVEPKNEYIMPTETLFDLASLCDFEKEIKHQQTELIVHHKKETTSSVGTHQFLEAVKAYYDDEDKPEQWQRFVSYWKRITPDERKKLVESAFDGVENTYEDEDDVRFADTEEEWENESVDWSDVEAWVSEDVTDTLTTWAADFKIPDEDEDRFVTILKQMEKEYEEQLEKAKKDYEDAIKSFTDNYHELRTGLEVRLNSIYAKRCEAQGIACGKVKRIQLK